MSTNYEYFFEEIPMSMILVTIKEIEKRLRAEELRLAEECSAGAAYVTLNLKKGGTVYVARAKKWLGDKAQYQYTVQLLDEDLKVLISQSYTEENGTHFDDDHYPVDPMVAIAARIIRRNGYKPSEVKGVLVK